MKDETEHVEEEPRARLGTLDEPGFGDRDHFCVIVKGGDDKLGLLFTEYEDESSILAMFQTADVAQGIIGGWVPLIVVKSFLATYQPRIIKVDKEKLDAWYDEDGVGGVDVHVNPIAEIHVCHIGEALREDYDNGTPVEAPEFSDSEAVGQLMEMLRP